MRALERTFAYIAENGPIGLTARREPSSAFSFSGRLRRSSGRAIGRPTFTPLNKVLNEWDFLPLAELHEIMLALKIGRHFKGTSG